MAAIDDLPSKVPHAGSGRSSTKRPDYLDLNQVAFRVAQAAIGEAEEAGDEAQSHFAAWGPMQLIDTKSQIKAFYFSQTDLLDKRAGTASPDATKIGIIVA